MGERFNEGQKRAIEHFKGAALVLAGPGSGKTRVITYRTKYLIEHYGVDPANILAHEQLIDLFVHEDKFRYYLLRGNLHALQQQLHRIHTMLQDLQVPTLMVRQDMWVWVVLWLH